MGDGLDEVGLVWADTDAPGYTRRRAGRGWSYLTPDGSLIKDPALRERLSSLALPPAWVDAWYCTDPRGHIQALASDDRARRQYLYHPDWRDWRDRAKFAHLADFIETLPTIRTEARAALGSDDAVESAIGVIVTLLDKGALRVGSERYAKANKAFGATTLRKRHVETGEAGLSLDFTAKGGKQRAVFLRDRRLADAVGRLDDLPGQRLFDIEDSSGTARSIKSTAVNDWLSRVAGDDVTAKDFRTLAGSVAAFDALVETAVGDTKRERDAALKAAYTASAQRLGNTVTVAKNSYVHPGIAAQWQEGNLKRIRGRAKRMALKASLPERAVQIIAREAS